MTTGPTRGARDAYVYPDDEMVRQLSDSLSPRLIPPVAESDIRRLVREVLDELAPVRVTNYLGILVERAIRERI